MFRQNIIASHTQPIELHKARIRNHNALIAILAILGVTIMFSFYVYQASVLYSTQLAIQAEQQHYARQQRQKAEALVLYAQTKSISTMVRRAQSSNFAPPQPGQITFIRPSSLRSDYTQNNSNAVAVGR